MVILGHPISKKAEILIQDIFSKLSKPVSFYPITEFQDGYMGAFDSNDPETYLVYLSTDLTGIHFETNVLHELFHIIQFEEGYPFTCTVTNPITIDNIDFFIFLGSCIQNSILDLDVDTKLRKHGYNSNFFAKINFERAKKIAETYTSLSNNGYDFIQLTSMLVLLILLSNKEQRNFILPLFDKKFDNITYDARKLCHLIKEIGYSTPLDAFKCIVEYFKYYDALWNVQYIEFMDQYIYSLDEAQRLIQEL